MTTKYRLAHFDGKPLAYSFDTLEDCKKVQARDGLFIIAISDDTGTWYITHHGTKDLGWVEHTLAQTQKSQVEATSSIALDEQSQETK